MEFDSITTALYQENINWVYSIIKELDSNGIECKETFIKDPYILNNIIALGYYFMNLYVISNIKTLNVDQTKILKSIVTGASTYNHNKLSKIYKQELDLNRLVDEYNEIVKKTKQYSPNDGLKARIVALDTVYRNIYPKFNIQHFKVFVRIFMGTFSYYEERIKSVIIGGKND